MKKKFLAALATIVATLGVGLATQATPAFAATCNNGVYNYFNDPGPGYITYGSHVSCTNSIKTYIDTICMYYASNNTQVPGTCHTVSGAPSWTIYSFEVGPYTIYLPNVSVYARNNYQITFK